MPGVSALRCHQVCYCSAVSLRYVCSGKYINKGWRGGSKKDKPGTEIERSSRSRIACVNSVGENCRVRTAFCKQANKQAAEIQGSATQSMFCSFKTWCAERLRSGASGMEGSQRGTWLGFHLLSVVWLYGCELHTAGNKNPSFSKTKTTLGIYASVQHFCFLVSFYSP